jgi:hypothetical protein
MKKTKCCEYTPCFVSYDENVVLWLRWQILKNWIQNETKVEGGGRGWVSIREIWREKVAKNWQITTSVLLSNFRRRDEAKGAFTYRQVSSRKRRQRLVYIGEACTWRRQRQQHMTVITAIALATLGGTTQIGSFLFVLRHPRWPRQVQ